MSFSFSLNAEILFKSQVPGIWTFRKSINITWQIANQNLDFKGIVLMGAILFSILLFNRKNFGKTECNFTGSFVIFIKKAEKKTLWKFSLQWKARNTVSVYLKKNSLCSLFIYLCIYFCMIKHAFLESNDFKVKNSLV